MMFCTKQGGKTGQNGKNKMCIRDRVCVLHLEEAPVPPEAPGAQIGHGTLDVRPVEAELVEGGPLRDDGGGPLGSACLLYTSIL